MQIRIVLIDDSQADRDRLSDRINFLGNLEVFALPPPSDLDLSSILDAKADLFLIDYELDTRQPDDSIANYQGMTLAARLREEMQDYPIVLLTRPDLQAWSSAQRIARFGGSIDSIHYKKNIESHPKRTLNKLTSMAEGYKVFRECEERSVASLLDLLKTDEPGQESALRATPPRDGWAAVEAASWRRSVLLGYPGILYDCNHAATALGISIDSFEQPPIQDLLRDATYQGPFAKENRRWWRHSLFEVAFKVCGGRERDHALREVFRVAASEKFGTDLQPSQDPQTGASPADTVCYVSGIPVRIETSLPYRPDNRPSVMDEARVSFQAIQETNDVVENYLDTNSRALLEEIRRQSHGD